MISCFIHCRTLHKTITFLSPKGSNTSLFSVKIKQTLHFLQTELSREQMFCGKRWTGCRLISLKWQLYHVTSLLWLSKTLLRFFGTTAHYWTWVTVIGLSVIYVHKTLFNVTKQPTSIFCRQQKVVVTSFKSLLIIKGMFCFSSKRNV